jgi:hypothetical protein
MSLFQRAYSVEPPRSVEKACRPAEPKFTVQELEKFGFHANWIR